MAVKKSDIILAVILAFFVASGCFIVVANADFAGDGNLVITGANSGNLVGGFPPINITSNPVNIAGIKTGTTISGNSAYGFAIKSGTSVQLDPTLGAGSLSEVTVIFTSAVVSMNGVVRIGQDTALSGGTVNVLFESGDNIVSQTPITAGLSKYQLSGTTFLQGLLLTVSSTSEWEVFEIGSPSVLTD